MPDPNRVAGRRQGSERRARPPQYRTISVGVVVVTSQRAPSSSPFLCKIQIIPPPSPIAAVHGFLSRSLTLRKEQ